MDDIASIVEYALGEVRQALEAAELCSDQEARDTRERALVTLSRIHHVATAAVTEHQQQHENVATMMKRQRVWDGDDAPLDVFRNVQRRLESSSAQSASTFGAATASEQQQSNHATTSVCSSLLNIQSVEQATCDVMSSGRGVVAVKGALPSSEGTITVNGGVVAMIRADQSALRRQLYLGHRRNDVGIFLSLSSRCGVEGIPSVSAALPTPPTEAVRMLASLNVKAECAFLQQAIWVDTKLALLIGWDQLQDTMDGITRKREAYFLKLGFPAASLPLAASPRSWFRVGSCNQGVVQIEIRNALRLTLCYARQTKRWDLQGCEWLIQQPEEGDNSTATKTVSIADHQVGAVSQQIRLAFAKSFVDGCCMGLDAAAGMWLECAELQLTNPALMDKLLQDHLAATNEVIGHSIDVQPNSGFIAVRIALTAAVTTSVACQTKFFVLDHSLFHQRTVGTDTALATLIDVLDQRPSGGGAVADAWVRLHDDWQACVAANRARCQ
ncbi:Hypothetical protein, putative [Bodo saltans]|uniref:Uncharacterized protein n=1 Tax=Bodo saltans TaxID=75058 RepID=A0A0S4IN23_BODSA|nr:Hypothetical protein, putative [Bodo saltans]|eukprot:CUF58937.1 Hypothetical protein, putative [Bodo saltans]